MKKLVSLMLGMALTFSTVAIVFAQDAPKKEEPTKAKKSPKKKKADTTKKEG